MDTESQYEYWKFIRKKREKRVTDNLKLMYPSEYSMYI